MANLDHLHGRAFALTGNTGSGKSSAASLFKDLGAHIINADELARAAVSPNTTGYKLLRKTFGNEYIQSDGHIDRKKLGRLIFQDPSQRAKLESILHPEVAKLYVKALDELDRAHQGEVILYDVPLYFEADLDRSTVSHTIVVYSPKNTCIERIMKRDSLSREDATQRYDAQIPIEEKVALADFVIKNTEDRDHLEQEVTTCYASLREILQRRNRI